MNPRIKKLTTISMLCALAYVVMVLGRIPISTVDFLKYDPKDIIITIGGFIYGPLSALVISLIVSFVEMLTVSGTGIIGAIMNVVSTCAFSCTASLIYKKKRTICGAIVGLVSGVLLATVVMLLWNYYLTPLYMGYPRAAVGAMLVPVFLPFNLIKGGLNMAATLIIYKPVVNALRKANLIPSLNNANGNKKAVAVGVTVMSLFLIICLVMLILLLKNII